MKFSKNFFKILIYITESVSMRAFQRYIKLLHSICFFRSYDFLCYLILRYWIWRKSDSKIRVFLLLLLKTQQDIHQISCNMAENDRHSIFFQCAQKKSSGLKSSIQNGRLCCERKCKKAQKKKKKENFM